MSQCIRVGILCLVGVSCFPSQVFAQSEESSSSDDASDAQTLTVDVRPLEICDNGFDDDGDRIADCDDPSCTNHPACGPAPRDNRPGSRGIYLPRQPSEMPTTRFVEHDDPRRFPIAHQAQPLTYLSGMLVPKLLLHIRPDPFVDSHWTTMETELTYAIVDDFQISLTPLRVALSPDVEFYSPTAGATLRMFRSRLLELGIRSNVMIPLRDDEGAIWRSGLPMLFHFGSVVRLDFSPIDVTLWFLDEVRTILELGSTRFAFQLSDYAYVAIRSGARLQSVDFGRPLVPLGFDLGASVPGLRRGPLMDVAFQFLWPSLFDPLEASGDIVAVDQWQATVNVRFFSYLTP